MGGHVALLVQDSLAQARLTRTLADDGYGVSCFSSVEEAARYLLEPRCPASVVVLNMIMRRQGDSLLIRQLTVARPELQILLVTQEKTNWTGPMLNGIKTIRLLQEPLDDPNTLARLRECLNLAAEAGLGISGAVAEPREGLRPYSDEFLRRVGEAEVPVLLCGETGVGKEVMARKLRSLSRRADKPFMRLNCAALPADLAESELFGSVKGAFTGSVADRQGRFELAQGGTILLDEIGDMDLRLQTKLLQVLQDGEIQPLGSSRTVRVNVRVMAATHRDLTKCIQDGTFREDLYYRLNVVKILIPPLRERRHEILPLAEEFLVRHLAAGQPCPRIDEALKRFLLEHSWPGNVRELENVMRRLLVYQDSSLLLEEMRRNLPHHTPILVEAGEPRVGDFHRKQTRPEQIDAAEGLDQLAELARLAEVELLLRTLEAHRWNRRKAAASLQIDYKAFLYKLQKYGVVEPRGKRQPISA